MVRRFDRSLRPNGARVARARIGLLILGFAGVYSVIAMRLVQLGVEPDAYLTKRAAAADSTATSRPNILDRSGRLLATDIKTFSLFGDPRRVIDVDEATELVTGVLPDLDSKEVRDRLASKRGFVWLKREITPQQQSEIHRLGLPGIGFLRENRRVYPSGSQAGHVLGHVNIDNAGIAGLEKWIDGRGLAELHQAGLASGRALQPIELALDLSVQHAVRDELQLAKDKFKAIAAAGLVVDVETGEIVSMVSLPDYDPNQPGNIDKTRLNRLTTGVFEMGSTFKALTVAMALDSGKVNLNSRFDATAPLRYGGFTIDDFRGQRRVLTTTEVFIHSSNIGSARMALSLGVDGASGISEKDGTARPAAHGVAGKRAAAPAAQLERAVDRDDRFRPRAFGGAVASGHGDGGARKWRAAHSADVPEAHGGRSQRTGETGHQARDEPADALPHAAQCGKGECAAGRGRRLLCGRKDRHFGKDRERPLCEGQGSDGLYGCLPRRQTALSAARHARRAAGVAGDPGVHDVGLERGPGGGQDHRPHRALIGAHAETGFADGGAFANAAAASR
jgi:hypothetical protein